MGLVCGAVFLMALSACQSQEAISEAHTATSTALRGTPTATLPAPLSTATRILDLEAGLTSTAVSTNRSTLLQPSATASGGRTASPTAFRTPTPTSLPQTATSASAAFESQSGAYPGPGFGGEAGTTEGAYPGIFSFQGAYPGVESGAENAYPGETGGIFGALGQVNPTLTPVPTRPQPTSFPNPTQVTSTALPRTMLPTALPTSMGQLVFEPRNILAEGASPKVEVWHPFQGKLLEVLEEATRAFQAANPQISLALVYVPLDDLPQAYETAVYQNRAPEVLIAPSTWNALLSSRALVADLTPYFPTSFWQALAPAALKLGTGQGGQTSLPFYLSGVVLYRNQKVITAPASSMEQLIQVAQKATRGSTLGAYFDLSAFNTMALYDSLGGRWMDEAGRPVFDRQDYRDAQKWLELLSSLDRAGAVEVNTNRDLTLFLQGKVGYVLDGTWNLQTIAQSIGAENLAIDLFPLPGVVTSPGYVESQNLYLNLAVANGQDAQLYAALQWIGAMLSPQVQRRLAESGFIPARQDISIQDRLIRQVAEVLWKGVPAPSALQGSLRQIYWAALEGAIRRGLGIGMEAMPYRESLRLAYLEIIQQLSAITK